MTETSQQQRVDTRRLRNDSGLRRSTTDRKVAGVAGGLGRHLDIDPTILRVVLVVLIFFGGAGLVLYGAAWLLVPEEGRTDSVISTGNGTRNALLIGAAVLAALLWAGDGWGGFGFPWPLALLALVVALVVVNRRDPASPPVHPAQSSAPATYPALPGAPAAAFPPPAPPATGATRMRQPKRGPLLFWLAFPVLAIALGSLWLYEVQAQPVDPAAYPALALAVIGALLVLGAWFGRPGGLVLLGFVTAVVLAVTAAGQPRFEGEREIDAAPTAAAEVLDRYFVPAGDIRVDLTDVEDLAALDGRTITVDANAGDIEVVLPQGVDVALTADVAVAGEAVVLGRSSNGPSVDVVQQIDGGTGVPEVDLDVELIFGRITVTQEASQA